MAKFYVLVESFYCNVRRSPLMVTARRFKHARSSCCSLANRITDPTKLTSSFICCRTYKKYLSTKSDDQEKSKALLEIKYRALPIAVINDAQLSHFKLLVVPLDFIRYDEVVMRSAFKACMQKSDDSDSGFTQFLTYVNSAGKPELVQLKQKASDAEDTISKMQSNLFDRIKDATRKLMIVNNLLHNKFPVKEAQEPGKFPHIPEHPETLEESEIHIDEIDCGVNKHRFYPEGSQDDLKKYIDKQVTEEPNEKAEYSKQPVLVSKRTVTCTYAENYNDSAQDGNVIGKILVNTQTAQSTQSMLSLHHNKMSMENTTKTGSTSIPQTKMKAIDFPIYSPVDQQTIDAGDVVHKIEFFPVEGKTLYETHISSSYTVPSKKRDPPEIFPVEGKTVFPKDFPIQEVKSRQELRRIRIQKRLEAEQGGQQNINSDTYAIKARNDNPPKPPKFESSFKVPRAEKRDMSADRANRNNISLTFDEEEDSNERLEARKGLDEVRKYLSEPTPVQTEFNMDIFSKIARQKRGGRISIYKITAVQDENTPTPVEYFKEGQTTRSDEYMQSRPELFTAPDLEHDDGIHAEEEKMELKEETSGKQERDEEISVKVEKEGKSFDEYKTKSTTSKIQGRERQEEIMEFDEATAKQEIDREITTNAEKDESFYESIKKFKMSNEAQSKRKEERAELEEVTAEQELEEITAKSKKDETVDEYITKPVTLRAAQDRRKPGARTIMPTSKRMPFKSIKVTMFAKGSDFFKGNSRTNANIASVKKRAKEKFLQHQEGNFVKGLHCEVTDKQNFTKISELEEINKMNSDLDSEVKETNLNVQPPTEDVICKQMTESAHTLEQQEEELLINKEKKNKHKMKYDARVVLKLSKPIIDSGLNDETQQLVKAAADVIYTPSTVKALKKLGFIIDALVVQNQVWGMKKLENRQTNHPLDMVTKEHADCERELGTQKHQRDITSNPNSVNELSQAEKRQILESPKISNIVFPLYQKEIQNTSSELSAPFKSIKKVLYGNECNIVQEGDNKTWSKVGKVQYDTKFPDESNDSLHVFKYNNITSRELEEQQNRAEFNHVSKEEDLSSNEHECQLDAVTPLASKDDSSQESLLKGFSKRLEIPVRNKRPLPISVRKRPQQTLRETSRVQTVTPADEDPSSVLAPNKKALHKAIAETETEVEKFLKEQEAKAEVLMEEWRRVFLRQFEESKEFEDNPSQPELPKKSIALPGSLKETPQTQADLLSKPKSVLYNNNIAPSAMQSNVETKGTDDEDVYINIYERIRWQEHNDNFQVAAEEQRYRQELLEKEIADRLNQYSKLQLDRTEKLEQSIRKYKKDLIEPDNEQDVISKTTINHVETERGPLPKQGLLSTALEAKFPEQRSSHHEREKIEKLHQRQEKLEKILFKAEEDVRKQIENDEKEIKNFNERIASAKQFTISLLQKRRAQHLAASKVIEKADEMNWTKVIDRVAQKQTAAEKTGEHAEYAQEADQVKTTEEQADIEAGNVEVKAQAMRPTAEDEQSTTDGIKSTTKRRKLITVLLRKPQVRTRIEKPANGIALKMILPKTFADKTPAVRKVIITDIINKAIFNLNKEQQLAAYKNNEVKSPKFDFGKMKEAFHSALQSPEGALDLQNYLQREVNKMLAANKLDQKFDNISITQENGGTMIIKCKLPKALAARITQRPTILREEHLRMLQTILELNLNAFKQHVMKQCMVILPTADNIELQQYNPDQHVKVSRKQDQGRVKIERADLSHKQLTITAKKD